jgi:DNA-binding NarL/FixJ family response regulator
MRGGDPRSNVVRMTLRCLIVDDSPAFVATARSLLESQGMSVLGAVATGADALRLTAELRPDVVLVDLDLGPESGLEVAARLTRSADPAPPPVILISTHEDFADLIAESPAVGFIPKVTLSVAAIRELLDGRGSADPTVTGPRGR